MPYDGHNPIDLAAFQQPAPSAAPARRRMRTRRMTPPAGPSAPPGPSFGPPPAIFPPDAIRDAVMRPARVSTGASVGYVLWRIVKFLLFAAIWLAWTICSLALRPFWHIGASPARPTEAYWSGRRTR